MNYLKDLFARGCGYLMDILFIPRNEMLPSNIFYTLPKPINDHPYIFSIFHYKNSTVKKIIKLIKYKGERKTTQIISRIIYDYLLEDMSDRLVLKNFKKPIIIPIPATKHRMKEYGFNQCERIVKYIDKLDGHKCFDLELGVLLKTKETTSQAHTKNKTERLGNIKNSFGIINPEKIKSRNIILIDDVWTTGATIQEARKELLEAGAREVIAYTIAH